MAGVFDGIGVSGWWRDPVGIGAFLVGLLPLFGLSALGWSLGALVVFYWLENLVIGAMALVRLAGAGLFGQGVGGPGARVMQVLFLAGFFVVHYGLFCFVHGIFVMNIFGGGGVMEEPGALVARALTIAPHIAAVLGVVAAWKGILLGIFFLGRGDVRSSSVMLEMAAPYGRIVLLHLAIFAGAFAMAALGEPFVGVALLVIAKALWDGWQDWRDAQAPGLTQKSPTL